MKDDSAGMMRLAVGGMLAMAAAVGIGRFIYTPILPPMAEALALSKGEAGLIASANFAGYLAGALAAAAPLWSARLRLWLLIALAVSGVTTGAMTWPDSMAAFLILRFIGGFASAFVLVFASALVLQRLAAARRGSLSSVHFAGVGVGITLSALLTWGVTAWTGDWRIMWLAGGIASLVALAAVVMLLPAEAGRDAGTRDGNVPGFSLRAAWPLITAYGLFGFGYIITATFIVDIVRASRELATVEPVVWLVVGIAAVPSVAAWSMLARRYGVTNVFAFACLVEAAGVVASVLWLDMVGILFAAAVLGGTFMGLTALGLMAARELAPANAGRLLALMTAAFGFGQIIGPAIAGFGHDLSGSYMTPSLLAAAGLCLAAVLARSRG